MTAIKGLNVAQMDGIKRLHYIRFLKSFIKINPFSFFLPILSETFVAT